MVQLKWNRQKTCDQTIIVIVGLTVTMTQVASNSTSRQPQQTYRGTLNRHPHSVPPLNDANSGNKVEIPYPATLISTVNINQIFPIIMVCQHGGKWYHHHAYIRLNNVGHILGTTLQGWDWCTLYGETSPHILVLQIHPKPTRFPQSMSLNHLTLELYFKKWLWILHRTWIRI